MRRGNMPSRGLKIVLLIAAVSLLMTNLWAASAKKLHNFGITNTDGVNPNPLIFDAAGNLYGTTRTGGSHMCNGSGCGTVFELSNNGSGGWTERVIHNFGAGTDGWEPRTSLIFDADGNLYGTTAWGGVNNHGTVFELSPNASGGWTETRLHDFGSEPDGALPYAGVIFGADGNLYGTTVAGGGGLGNCHFDGVPGCGSVFELSPDGSGGWTETTLYSFSFVNGGATNPFAGLIFDSAGNLYGTSRTGGSYGSGTAFELLPNGRGGWRYKVIHNFGITGADGQYPYASLIFDAAGNLYSTTLNGGSQGFGAVYEMSPNGSGGWTERVIHNFGISGTDGQYPDSAVILDSDGNLYGTTEGGGTLNSGTVFKMTPNGSGGWTETKLHNFGNGTDGVYPDTNLLFDSAGNLYGATFQGGNYNDGTVFEITP
jgi:uncharacterized repeat protein (TIGR03803 family)